jgi:hypothetical protein
MYVCVCACSMYVCPYVCRSGNRHGTATRKKRQAVRNSHPKQQQVSRTINPERAMAKTLPVVFLADCALTGLFCALTGLFCALTGLFCALTGLFCALTGPFCTLTGLFCALTGLFCALTGLFCALADMQSSAHAQARRDAALAHICACLTPVRWRSAICQTPSPTCGPCPTGKEPHQASPDAKRAV